MEKIVVEFEIDRESLNEYLGNTPNVTLGAALSEYLDELFDRNYFYCDRCGSGSSEATNVNGKFTIIEGAE